MKTTKSILLVSWFMACGLAAAADNHGHAPHWEYEGKAGPAQWGSLEKDFVTCKIGGEQSPIDISTKATEKAKLPGIKTAYSASAGELVNNGHTIQINLAEGGSATVPSGSYKLLQFHFHTPSEEKINGKNFPLVAHMVHKNDAGNLAVIGVLFKQGQENKALKDIFAALPAKEGKEALKQNFDATTLLPANMGYYAFKGSLTTPPCSEGVAWQVLKTPVEMSKAQIQAFQKVFKMNARPVQPLNQRKVLDVSE
ncbi:MAG: carbonic anhydrase [Limnohabitans sp.]